MTKSKGIGRGGVRKGSGRRPAIAKVDWEALGRAYFSGKDTIENVCRSFGVTYGELLAYAVGHHWVLHPSPSRHPDDPGDLGSALAIEMYSVDVNNRARRFVAAMVKLGADEADIADPLNIPVETLRRQFARELHGD
jgi:hypothetical protein